MFQVAISINIHENLIFPATLSNVEINFVLILRGRRREFALTNLEGDDFRVSGEFCTPRNLWPRVGPRAIDYEPRHACFSSPSRKPQRRGGGGGGDYFRRRPGSLFGRPDVIKTACPSLSLALRLVRGFHSKASFPDWPP